MVFETPQDGVACSLTGIPYCLKFNFHSLLIFYLMVQFTIENPSRYAWVNLRARIVVAWAVREQMPHIELVEPTILLILDSYILNTASLRDIVETATN